MLPLRCATLAQYEVPFEAAERATFKDGEKVLEPITAGELIQNDPGGQICELLKTDSMNIVKLFKSPEANRSARLYP